MFKGISHKTPEVPDLILQEINFIIYPEYTSEYSLNYRHK